MPTPFPVFASQAPEVAVEREWPADEFVSASGRKISTSYWTTPVRHFRLIFNGLQESVTAASPWNAYNEVAALRAVYAQMNGQLGTIALTDPEGGADVTVKFEAPLVLERVLPGLWRATVELVEVL